MTGGRAAPRVFPLERLIEFEDIVELVARVRRLAHQQPEIHQGEDHVAEVRRRFDSPALEDETRHDPEALESEIAAGEGELPSIDVTPLGKSLLTEFAGGQDKQRRALVEARLAHPDPVHDPIAKGQLCQANPPANTRRGEPSLAASNIMRGVSPRHHSLP